VNFPYILTVSGGAFWLRLPRDSVAGPENWYLSLPPSPGNWRPFYPLGPSLFTTAFTALPHGFYSYISLFRFFSFIPFWSVGWISISFCPEVFSLVAGDGKSAYLVSYATSLCLLNSFSLSGAFSSLPVLGVRLASYEKLGLPSFIVTSGDRSRPKHPPMSFPSLCFLLCVAFGPLQCYYSYGPTGCWVSVAHAYFFSAFGGETSRKIDYGSRYFFQNLLAVHSYVDSRKPGNFCP